MAWVCGRKIPALDAITPGCDALGAAGLPRNDVAKKILSGNQDEDGERDSIEDIVLVVHRSASVAGCCIVWNAKGKCKPVYCRTCRISRPDLDALLDGRRFAAQNLGKDGHVNVAARRDEADALAGVALLFLQEPGKRSRPAPSARLWVVV
jgi:hypothetical protein